MDTWHQNPQSQIENQNFVPQPVSYNPPNQAVYDPSSTQSINNNSNNPSIDTSLQSWENGGLNITQPAQLPWTYSAPQYCNPGPDLSTDFSSTVPSNLPWNYNSVSAPDSEISNKPPSNHLSSDNNSINGAVNLDSSLSQNFIADDHNDKISNSVPSNESVNLSRDTASEAEYGVSSLSAFFQSSDQNNSHNSECGDISASEIKDALDESSLAENLSQLQINESEKSSVPTEDEQDERNLEDTDDGGNQEVNFIQEEDININANVSQPDNTVGFVEG